MLGVMSLGRVCFEVGKSYLEVFVGKVCIKCGAPVCMVCMICVGVSYALFFQGSKYILLCLFSFCKG